MTRFALALGTSAVGATALLVVYERSRTAEVVAFARPDGFATRSDDAPDLPGPVLSDRELPTVLDVGPGDLPRWPRSTFVRRPLQESEVARLFDIAAPAVRYDPHAYFTHAPNLDFERPFEEHPRGVFQRRTNELGLRSDDPVAEPPPDVRILIAGDSHVDGVCDNAEGFPALLEADLAARHPGTSIEVLNAANGGYNFYHYLGTLERLLHLRPDVFVVTVYGGNDFLGGVFLHHHFARTRASAGVSAYMDEVEAAREIHAASIAQAFQSLKYFEHNPHEKEVALQMARDVSTEIQVACLRGGIELVFVYLPPFTDVEWDAQAERAERMAEAFHLGPDARGSTDELADSLLEFLVDRGVTTLDLRPALRAAGPGHYWLDDAHINLRGQRLVADEVLSVLERRRVVERVRTRIAPGPSREDLARIADVLLTPGANRAAGRPSRRPEAVELLDERRVREAYGLDESRVYDPATLFRYAPDLALHRGSGAAAWTLRTNSDGYRDDEPVRDDLPRLRVLFAGDENVDGPWSNEASVGRLLERRLALDGADVECLHGAVEGHSIPSYLGVLRNGLSHLPDVFVMTVSGGTDLLELAELTLLQDGAELPLRKRIADARALEPAAMDQGLASAAVFARRKQLRDVVEEDVLELGTRVADLCRDNGVRPIVVYVPPASAVEPERRAGEVGRTLDALGLDEDELRVFEAFARGTVLQLRGLSLEVVDLTDRLARSGRPAYAEDWRLGPVGQEILAEALVPLLRGAE